MRDEKTSKAAMAALRMVCVTLPHLSGLAHLARISADRSVATAGIFASGRMLVNPDWFGQLAFLDQVFVVAHELLHLAFQTHQREIGTDPLVFNVAHDYIINDVLVESLSRPVPGGGLEWAGARHLSAEQIVQQIRWQAGNLPPCWGAAPGGASALGAALAKAGLADPSADLTGGSDVLSGDLERRLFPGVSTEVQARESRQVRIAASKAASLGALQEAMNRLGSRGADGVSGTEEQSIEALHALYRPPWELALQQWMEAVAPGGRSYARPSRRGAVRTDLALAGRKREGWTLHIVLDTSGSMSSEFSRILGAIASFCEGANVAATHILQCDEDVTRDEFIAPEELHSFTIAGFGGSDMTPGLRRLAQDVEVEVAMVITDGFIYYPVEPMPYHVLWVMTCENEEFSPPYGQILAHSHARP